MASAETQQIISLKDERLDIDQLDHYRLSFFIGIDSIELAIKDAQTNRLLLFEKHVPKANLSLTQQLSTIHKNHVLIAAGFWKEIQVFFRNSQFALIPAPFFDKSKLLHYVRLNEKTDPQEDGYHFKQLDQFGLSFAFGYKESVKTWFRTNYPKVNLKFSHQGIAFLKQMEGQLKPNAQASLSLDLKGQSALIGGLNFRKLAIYNQFQFKNAEHLIKLTALSCQQFSQDRAKTPLIITGEKNEVEIFSEALKKYFPLLETGVRPAELKVHPVFNELEAYEYTEILANL